MSFSLFNIHEMLNLLFIIITFINCHPNMGTQYYLVPEKETKCEDEFPGGFSAFLGSEDAYGEKSEYYKVCKATGKTLNFFAEKAVGFDDNGEEVWIDIKTMKDTLMNFLHAFDSIHFDKFGLAYDPRKALLDSLYWEMLGESDFNGKFHTEYKKLDSAVMYDSEHPYYFLPPDYKYISAKKLSRDLIFLINMLDCYSKEGSKRVKIVYE